MKVSLHLLPFIYREYQNSVAIESQGTKTAAKFFRNTRLRAYFKGFRDRSMRSRRLYDLTEQYIAAGLSLQTRYAMNVIRQHALDSLRVRLLSKGSRHIDVRVGSLHFFVLFRRSFIFVFHSHSYRNSSVLCYSHQDHVYMDGCISPQKGATFYC